jgi:hypothetical protein
MTANPIFMDLLFFSFGFFAKEKSQIIGLITTRFQGFDKDRFEDWREMRVWGERNWLSQVFGLDTLLIHSGACGGVIRKKDTRG